MLTVDTHAQWFSHGLGRNQKWGKRDTVIGLIPWNVYGKAFQINILLLTPKTNGAVGPAKTFLLMF